MKSFLLYIFLFCMIVNLTGCKNSEKELTDNYEPGNQAVVEVSFEVDKEIYFLTDYGEPPQIAVWLEYPDSKFYKTIWVTRRTGKNDWEGKVECAVSLPYWNMKKENEAEPGFWKKVVDAISGATVAEGTIKRNIKLPKNKLWKYFIEVNASGDYNKHFSYWSDNDVPDTEGNGQPSIIYSGEITTDSAMTSIPNLIGRTDQLSVIDSFYTDIEKITTAGKLIKNIKVKSY